MSSTSMGQKIQSETPTRYDYAIVGGGLQGGLVALALRALRPEATVALVERNARLGGNHLWCFHQDDVPELARSFVMPLVVRQFPGYEVRFPGRRRHIRSSYSAVTTERLHEAVTFAFSSRPGWRLLSDTAAREVRPDEVLLGDGEKLRAKVVVDCRGPSRFPLESVVGYQKFLGLELRVRDSSVLETPLLMDATVSQVDGFRFFYGLELAPGRVLVEDTYFSESSVLDVPHLRGEILAYATRTGLEVLGVEREETGVLPLPIQRTPTRSPPITGGYAGGWFHPVTGYSFPVALRLALHLATHAPERVFGPDWGELNRQLQRQSSYLYLLNRMMFGAFSPDRRYGALERFYGLPEDTIRRFYAMTLDRRDQLRILCGKPPSGISLYRAIKEVWA